MPLIILDYVASHSAGRDGYTYGCGGDGGEPWAAPTSPLGKFCDHLNAGGLDTWLVYPVPLLAAAVGFVLIYLPRRGWRPTRWKVTAIVVGVALVAGSFVPPATVIYLDYSLSPVCQGTFRYDRRSLDANRILERHFEDCSSMTDPDP